MTQPGPKPVSLLVSEVRRIAALLDRVGDALHAGSGLSAAARELLETIALGPATVPELAQRRGVSRQHIQALVDQLALLGLVERRANPAHKRSAFIVATAAGGAALHRKQELERPITAALAGAVADADAALAAAALARLREKLEAVAVASSPG